MADFLIENAKKPMIYSKNIWLTWKATMLKKYQIYNLQNMIIFMILY